MGKHNKEMDKNKGRTKKRGIKGKLIGFILPCVAAVLLIIIVFSYLMSVSIVNSSANGRLTAEAQAVTNDVSGWVTEKIAILETVRGVLESNDMTDEELMKYLVYTVTLNEAMPYGVYIGDAQNNYLDPTWEPDAGFVPSERDWYKEGMTHETIALGVPYMDAQSGEFVVSASAKVQNVLGKDAVMASDIFLADMSETISQYTVLDTGYCFMVDVSSGEAIILAHPNTEFLSLTSAELAADSLEMQALQYIDEDKIVKNVTAGGVEYLLGVNHIENSNWIIFSCATMDSILEETRQLLTKFAIILVLGLFAIAVVIERMTHMIVKPILGLTDNIKEMSEGNFGIEVRAKGNDEVGIMSRQLQEFIKNMRAMIEDINDASGKMSNQAQNSIQISETLHTSAATQASSMKELNMTVEQLANSVMVVANNASSLADIVSQAGERGRAASDKMVETVSISREGRENMENIEAAMKEIEHSVTKLQEVVTAVGASTEEISKFVGMIGDIASQTNLLSLNASIEAARAGEAGRGFAVVAEEIGQLADTSSEAVVKISQITGEINAQVGDTVRQTAESLKCIQENSEQVSKACDTFDIIFNTINEAESIVNEMVNDIREVDGVATSVAAVTEEQSASTEEILATAENLTQLAGNVTDNSQVVADDAENLAETADVLSEHMKGFRV